MSTVTKLHQVLKSMFIIRDTVTLALTVPFEVIVEASSLAGDNAIFFACASDVVDSVSSVMYIPSSGSLFAFGSSTVTCTSTDQHDNIVI